jgi:hypothetical protein
MADNAPFKAGDIKPDVNNLYREEIFTDLKVATLRSLTPVKPDGSDDTSRQRQFIAQTHVMTPGGPIPVQAPIEADDLGAAMDQFPKAIEQGIHQMIEEAKAAQREEASRIVVPGQDTPPNLTLK